MEGRKMGVRRTIGALLVTVLWIGSLVAAQERRFPLPMEPIGNANEAVFPAYEGWGESQDGQSYYIVLGYRNRNRTQTDRDPRGPRQPDRARGPDYGQPTVFEPGRQTTVFAIKVPKDFGEKKLTWTLVANGQPAVVTFYLNPAYNMAFFREDANGNDAPRLKLRPDAPMSMGPSAGIAETLTAAVGQPVALKAWASDAPPAEKNWEAGDQGARAACPGRRRSQIAVVDGRVIGAPRRRRPARRRPRPTYLRVEEAPRSWCGRGHAARRGAAHRWRWQQGGRGQRDRHVLGARGVVLVPNRSKMEDGFDGLCCFTFANVKVDRQVTGAR